MKQFLNLRLKQSVILIVVSLLATISLADGVPINDEVTLTVIPKSSPSDSKKVNATDPQKSDVEVSLNDSKTLVPAPFPPPIAPPQPPRRKSVPLH